MKIESCPLCAGEVRREIRARERRLLECGECRLVFARRQDRLPVPEQRGRYLLHENTIENAGYREFLGRVIRAARPHLPAGGRGVDYGCGPGPTLSILAAREGFRMTDYDPLFLNVPLSPPYDFLFSTECFEHFEEPGTEIPRALSLLRKGGILAIMTELWEDDTDFDRWYYASDPTHVSFYSRETLDFILRRFGLKLLWDDGKRVFVFEKE